MAGYPFRGGGGDTPAVGDGPVGVVEGPLFFYDVDTEDGQSGAPVLRLGNSTGVGGVIGIHSAATVHRDAD